MKIRKSNPYLILSMIFLVILCLSIYHNNKSLSDICINILCSIVSATLLATVIEEITTRQETIEKNKFKKLYFEDINEDFSQIIGHILWFEEYKDEGFINWNNPVSSFLNFKFNIHASQFTKAYPISFEEAEKRLEYLSKKYARNEIQKMSNNEKNKVNKIFNIISHDCINVLIKLNQLENNKIELDVGNYMKINELNDLINHMKMCSYMFTKETAYEFGISQLISSAKQMREIGKYNKNINVEMHKFTINFFDLQS